MERPVATIEALNWRLRGPIGVLAVANAIVREAQSDGERCFLVSEIALELNRTRPESAIGCVAVADVRREIAAIAKELRDLIQLEGNDVPENLGKYISSVFKALSI